MCASELTATKPPHIVLSTPAFPLFEHSSGSIPVELVQSGFVDLNPLNAVGSAPLLVL